MKWSFNPPAGGNLFWQWFAEKVADEVVKHKDTRLLNELKEVCKKRMYQGIENCSTCYLPCDTSMCMNCDDVYCGRVEYCVNDNGSGVFFKRLLQL
jgi:uncharacterized UBP type Zn finger protein